MKPLRYTLIALVAACGLSNAETAYTTPVGYTTTDDLNGNQFNLISLTVHNPTVSAGVITGESNTDPSVTVAGVDFVALLGAPSADNTHVLELPDGTIQEIILWDAAGKLTTAQDITGSVVPGTTTYKLRKAATISSIFGATNSAGLKSSPDGVLYDGDGAPLCDTVQIFNGTGFDEIYYFDDGTTTGWFDAGSAPAADKAIIYADGIYIRRAPGTPIKLVVVGEVKLTPTSGVLTPGFNYLGAVAPVGLTLGTSTLKDWIVPSPDGVLYDLVTGLPVVDLVQLPLADGSYRVCYYFNDGTTTGWFDEGSAPVDDEALDGGFLIYSVSGANKPYSVAVPASYATL